jgi:hypothetical protein
LRRRRSPGIFHGQRRALLPEAAPTTSRPPPRQSTAPLPASAAHPPPPSPSQRDATWRRRTPSVETRAVRVVRYPRRIARESPTYSGTEQPTHERTRTRSTHPKHAPEAHGQTRTKLGAHRDREIERERERFREGSRPVREARLRPAAPVYPECGFNRASSRHRAAAQLCSRSSTASNF